MAAGSMILWAAASLIALLGLARARDRSRQLQMEGRMNAILTPRGRETLDCLTIAVRENDLGVRVCRKALREQNVENLRRAVGYVEGFAPGLFEGLAAMRQMMRSVSIIVDLPPVRPLAFRAWRLRELAVLAALVHIILVAGAERMRLRVWLLGRALSLCLVWLRGASEGVAHDHQCWAVVERTLADLATVGVETGLTYGRVIRCLDAVDRLVRAPAHEAPMA